MAKTRKKPATAPPAAQPTSLEVPQLNDDEKTITRGASRTIAAVVALMRTKVNAEIKTQQALDEFVEAMQSYCTRWAREIANGAKKAKTAGSGA